jgi:hypothetical protein
MSTPLPGHVKVVRWNADNQQFVDTGITYSIASPPSSLTNGDRRPDITADVADGHYGLLGAVQHRGILWGTAQYHFTAGCPARVTDTDGDGRAELVAQHQTPAKTCRS